MNVHVFFTPFSPVQDKRNPFVNIKFTRLVTQILEPSRNILILNCPNILSRPVTWTGREVPGLAPLVDRAGRLVVDVVKVGVGERLPLERAGGAAQVAHPEPRERPVVAPAAARVRPAVGASVVAHAEVGGGLK